LTLVDRVRRRGRGEATLGCLSLVSDRLGREAFRYWISQKYRFLDIIIEVSLFHVWFGKHIGVRAVVHYV
jgi:hypothetical protein